MSALWGHVGQSAQQSSALMQQTLSHRGEVITTLSTAQTCIGRVSAHCETMLVEPVDAPDLQVLLSGHLQQGSSLNVNELKIAVAEYQQSQCLDDLKQWARSLRGAFVVAIVTPSELFLVRDQAGQRALSYIFIEADFCFASESNAFRALPKFHPHLRPEAVREYLTYSFLPGATTMLEGVYDLGAGELLCYQRNQQQWSVHRYACFEQTTPETLTESSTAKWVFRFRTAMQQSISAQLPPTGKVGVFLSGGLDSSVVCAELCQLAPGRVATYSLHFGRNYRNELDFARAVAQRWGTEHHEVEITTRQIATHLPEMVERLDSPIGDPITLPNYLLARHVKQDGIDLIFNGEGGDPCFGGPKNLPMMLSHFYGRSAEYDAPDWREKLYLSTYRRAYEEREMLIAEAFKPLMGREDHLADYLTPFFQAQQPACLLNKLMLINIHLKGAHLILPKVERMLGAHQLTPIAPLFDERMLELSFSMPPQLKLYQGIEKRILKLAYRDLLPEAVLNRPKSGMRVPVHYWFQRDLKPLAKKLLDRRSLRQAGIWNPDRVKQLIAYETEEGPGRYGLRLWMLLTFELWRRGIWGDGAALRLKSDHQLSSR